MTVRQLGGKSDQARDQPAAALRPQDPARRRQHQVDGGDPAAAPSRSTSATSATSAREKELAATQCAGRTPIGKATTTTPLLDQPLSGPVYAVSGSGGLPRLAFILNGQVNLMPRAETDDRSRAAGCRRRSRSSPTRRSATSASTSSAARRGYLVNTRSLCVNTPVIRVDFSGQNSKTHSQKLKLKAPCGKGKNRPKREG